VVYTALVLNRRGLERAMASGIKAVEISLSASDAHSRKNAGMPHGEAMHQGLDMIDQAISAGLHVRASVQCAFGCVDEGSMPAAGLRTSSVGLSITGPMNWRWRTPPAWDRRRW
jgi:hydroxymethylglutaryl-CoA lyase